jgi:tetraacyldisaccharide 4'-kinase
MYAPAFYALPHPTPLALALAPLGALYGWVAQRHGAWRERNAYYAAIPVIGIGNIVAGGSGKTPLVAALAQHYAAQGHQIAVVLRGYKGRESQRPLQVTFQHSAQQVGDEAAMLFTMLPSNVQVWVGKHRPSVVRRAEQAGATLIVLDDAFQRRDVARQADVLVFNGTHPFGNGLCLPAGPLREPTAGVSRAHFAVHFNAPVLAPHEAPAFYGTTTYRLNVTPDKTDIEALKGKRLAAFAGIGQPEKFFNTLRNAGLNVVATQNLPDHCTYPAARLQALQAWAAEHNATLVTTTKDTVKLPEGFAANIGIAVGGEDWENVIAALDNLIR